MFGRVGKGVGRDFVDFCLGIWGTGRERSIEPRSRVGVRVVRSCGAAARLPPATGFLPYGIRRHVGSLARSSSAATLFGARAWGVCSCEFENDRLEKRNCVPPHLGVGVFVREASEEMDGLIRIGCVSSGFNPDELKCEERGPADLGGTIGCAAEGGWVHDLRIETPCSVDQCVVTLQRCAAREQAFE